MIKKDPDLTGLSILIFIDDAAYQKKIGEEFKDFGAEVYSARNLNDASEILKNEDIHAILISLNLADEKCINTISNFKLSHTDTLFYLITEENHALVEPLQYSVKAIVDDYFRKPLDTKRVASTIETHHGRPVTSSTALSVVEPIIAKAKPYFLFRSQSMRHALSNLPEIAVSGQTVLISGETGTGKELVARAIHVLSHRSNGPFVPVNCGAIPESLIEGELFGHEKGSFTGAYRSRKGKFESADKGTLFLDEIGDMSVSLQVRLLRVLEDKKIYRLGGESPFDVDVRVIAATQVELEKAVKDGLFREDLYYRINVLRIHIPPLRQRKDDIPLLFLHFLERAFSEMGRSAPFPTLSAETIHLLQHYQWKGNVRELRNVVNRIATLLPPDTTRVFPIHIIPHFGDTEMMYTTPVDKENSSGVVIPEGTQLKEAEDILIQEALKQTGGNRTRAAKILGISPRTLRRKLNR